MQYVEFVLGNAVLTPPIQRDGRFLAGERITLGEQAFVVAGDDQPASSRQAPAPKGAAADIRRIVVVEAWRWTKAVIDRDFKWPADGETSTAGKPAKKPAKPEKPKSKRPKPRGKDGKDDPQ